MAKNEAVATISADDLLELQKRAEILSSEKLILVTGPSFGTVVKLLALGAALGAAGALLLQSRASQDETTDSSSTSDEKQRTLAARFQTVLGRAKSIASRARDAAEIVAEAARPAIEEAVNHGKAASIQAQRELEAEISKEEA